MLPNLKKFPINPVFMFSYYDKILFTHRRKFELIALFTLHVMLLIFLYISPMIYNNITFNCIYLSMIVAMICGWILFRGECWITLFEKKILNPDYKSGEQLDVNPSVDLIFRHIVDFMIKIGILKRNEVDKISDDRHKKYRSARYKIPLIMPYMSFILFLMLRFPKVSMKYKVYIILLFTSLIIVSHYRWKHVNNGYHSI
jgi:hypothetical protein